MCNMYVFSWAFVSLFSLYFTLECESELELDRLKRGTRRIASEECHLIWRFNFPSHGGSGQVRRNIDPEGSSPEPEAVAQARQGKALHSIASWLALRLWSLGSQPYPLPAHSLRFLSSFLSRTFLFVFSGSPTASSMVADKIKPGNSLLARGALEGFKLTPTTSTIRQTVPSDPSYTNCLMTS